MHELPASRRLALRDYLVAVCQDLAVRGVIRWKKGQPLEGILRVEGEKILREVRQDFASVMSEIGVGVGAQLVGGLTKWLAGKVAGKMAGK